MIRWGWHRQRYYIPSQIYLDRAIIFIGCSDRFQLIFNNANDNASVFEALTCTLAAGGNIRRIF